jgi:hypothetical protein
MKLSVWDTSGTRLSLILLVGQAAASPATFCWTRLNKYADSLQDYYGIADYQLAQITNMASIRNGPFRAAQMERWSGHPLGV